MPVYTQTKTKLRLLYALTGKAESKLLDEIVTEKLKAVISEDLYKSRTLIKYLTDKDAY